MDKLEILGYLDYSLSMLQSEVSIYKTALRICDFETAKSELYHIEEKCHYLEMLIRAYRDAIINYEE